MSDALLTAPAFVPFPPSFASTSRSSSTTTVTHTAESVVTASSTFVSDMPPPSTIPKKRKLPASVAVVAAPTQSSASPSAASQDGDEASSDQDDEAYDPQPGAAVNGAKRSTGTPAKRSRPQVNAVAGPSSTPATANKPTGSGQGQAPKGRQLSREQLRKANHSLIEKRRREKINAALQALRDMVPSLGGADTSGKAGEFKLEVLERTVEHMRELKDYIATLEDQAASRGTSTIDNEPGPSRVRPAAAGPSRKVRKARQTTSTPPTPSTSPDSDSDEEPDYPHHAYRSAQSAHVDPDETEPEAVLPPAGAVAHGRRSRSSRDSPSDDTNSTASLLPPATAPGMRPSILDGLQGGAFTPAEHARRFAQSSRHGSASPQSAYPAPLVGHAVPSSRPAPPPQAHNPTLYLPFPTPSPTSPFLTYSTTASSSSGPPEPSPFLAPLQNINMSLFGGVINLDQPAMDSVVPTKRASSHSERDSPPTGQMAKLDRDEMEMGPRSRWRDRRGMEPEEAANVLLAISSPDTLRPLNGISGLTPKMIPINGNEDVGGMPGGVPRTEAHGRIKRRSTLESEEFRLDAVASGTKHLQAMAKSEVGPVGSAPSQGKTASDILQL